MIALKHSEAGPLVVAYREHGPSDGPPVFLMHGFPYDVEAYADVAPLLAASGCRAIVPYLRGYGPTRFRDAATVRSGQQGALGADLRALMDALGIRRACLAGYDWGGRAACVVAALWPERVTALVSCGNGYNINNIAASGTPAQPEQEHRFWYQYYLHGARGAAGLKQNRRELCRLLWRQWSPAWDFDDATFERTAPSFDNPDFVEVVIQSYRHRFGLAPGDPRYDEIERALATQPPIAVPTIALLGAANGIDPLPGSGANAGSRFAGFYRRDIVPGGGHNLPQEKPEAVARAILDLLGR